MKQCQLMGLFLDQTKIKKNSLCPKDIICFVFDYTDKFVIYRPFQPNILFFNSSNMVTLYSIQKKIILVHFILLANYVEFITLLLIK